MAQCAAVAAALLASAGAASELPDHLALYFDFDEEGADKISDVSAYQNDGFVEGTVSWQDSQYGQALVLNGSSGVVSVPASDSLTSLKSPMSLGILFNPITLPAGFHKMFGMYAVAGSRGKGWTLEMEGNRLISTLAQGPGNEIRPFDGLIDEVHVYDRGLSATEMLHVAFGQ